MTREEARKAAEVMLAYANGEKIEYREYGNNEWCDVDNPCFHWSMGDYRVQLKPKSKNKFDPKTLKPFDKVITKFSGYPWKCDIFSHYMEREDKSIDCYCTSEDYVYGKCIPYNDDTKHLVGTCNDAPEFYRYWEE